jgi:hypothetical protein
MMVHTCNPSYSGGGGRGIVVQAWDKSMRSFLKQTNKYKLKQKEWGCGSTEFKSQYQERERERKKKKG